MTEEEYGSGNLDAVDQERLTVLLPGSLCKRLVTSRLPAVGLSETVVAKRLQNLVHRGVVAHTP